MKIFFGFILLLHLTYTMVGQETLMLRLDSLERALSQSKEDTTRLKILEELGLSWQYQNLNKSTQYIEQAYALAQKLELTEWTYGIMYQLAYNYMIQNDAPRSIQILQTLIKTLQGREGGLQTAMAFLSMNYKELNDFDNALLYAQESFVLNERLMIKGGDYDPRGYYGGPMNLAEIFEKMNRLDSALYYAQFSYQRLVKKEVVMEVSIFDWQIPWIYGKVESKLNKNAHAFALYNEALKSAQAQEYNLGIQAVEVSLGQYFNKINQADSAIYYATRAFEGAIKTPNYGVISEAGYLLKSLHEKNHNISKAFYYLNLAQAAKDTVSNIEKMQKVQVLAIKETQRQAEIEAERIAYKTRIRYYLLSLGLFFLGMLVFFLYRNNRHKQKLNEQLRLQKTEIENLNNGLEQKVEERTAELKKAVDEVQSAFNKGQTSERKRVSADLHDEIGSALSTIAIFSDLAKTKAQKFAPDLVTELERIGIKSRDMIQTMRDTIWTLKEDSHQSVWERMHISSSETLNAQNIILHWQLLNPNDLPDISFNTKRHLFLAYKEAIHNIVKHAEATAVTVETIPHDDGFTLKISDNGKGFDKNNVQKEGNGLHNFEKRMVEIGGTVHIESSGKGTCILFSFPMHTLINNP